MRTAIALAVAIGIACPPAVKAGFEGYPVRSITSVLTEHVPEENSEYLKRPGDRYLEAGAIVAKTRMVCFANTRAIPEEHQKFLRQYFQGRRQAQMAELFKEELSCREGSREYWLPVQEPVMLYFKKEVSPGAPVDLFVMFVGSFRSRNSELVNLFVINEFAVVSEVTK